MSGTDEEVQPAVSLAGPAVHLLVGHRPPTTAVTTMVLEQVSVIATRAYRLAEGPTARTPHLGVATAVA